MFFVTGHVTANNLDYYRIFEQRYLNMVQLVLSQDKQFLVCRQRSDRCKVGYMVKIMEIRQNEERAIIIKVKGVARVRVDEFYLPEDNTYPTEADSLWFARGEIHLDKWEGFDTQAERSQAIEDQKQRAQNLMLRLQ